jgi:hypothetical protein
VNRGIVQDDVSGLLVEASTAVKNIQNCPLEADSATEEADGPPPAQLNHHDRPQSLITLIRGSVLPSWKCI